MAVMNKGQIYTTNNVKKGMEEKYKKTMRILCFVLGPLMLATGLIDMNASTVDPTTGMSVLDPTMRTISMVLWIVSMIVIGIMFVSALRMTDREKAKKNRTNNQPPAPRSAFEFDDDDKAEK